MKRCAWPDKTARCTEPAPFRRPRSMLDYCHDHYLAVLTNREAMFQPVRQAS